MTRPSTIPSFWVIFGYIWFSFKLVGFLQDSIFSLFFPFSFFPILSFPFLFFFLDGRLIFKYLFNHELPGQIILAIVCCLERTRWDNLFHKIIIKIYLKKHIGQKHYRRNYYHKTCCSCEKWTEGYLLLGFFRQFRIFLSSSSTWGRIYINVA